MENSGNNNERPQDEVWNFDDLKNDPDYIESSFRRSRDKSEYRKRGIEEYEKLCLEYFDNEKEFKKFMKKLRTPRSFFENVFSLKNYYDGAIKYKVITILGIKLYLKPKKKV